MKLPITLSFDDFVSLTKTMFISNRYIEINISVISKWWTELDWCVSSINDLDEMKWRNEITINSIKVSIPSFSIWDTVMIVDTGEVGYIYSIYWDRVSIYSTPNKPTHRQLLAVTWICNIVKIPSDLLPILQA